MKITLKNLRAIIKEAFQEDAVLKRVQLEAYARSLGADSYISYRSIYCKINKSNGLMNG